MTEENKPINTEQEAERLIDKLVNDFRKRIISEEDLSTILIKGHLLIEYYLNYIIILLHDLDERVDKKTFDEKIKTLEQDNCLPKNAITCLYKLNSVRNNLSHELEYNISESEIDSIGFHLGKKYIFEKFEKNCENKKELRDLFIWVLNKVLFLIFLPIFKQILEQKERTLKAETKQYTTSKTIGLPPLPATQNTL